MHKKVLFLWSITILFLVIPLGGGDGNGAYENNNDNVILLKAGTIHTDTDPVDDENESSEIYGPSVASYSVDATENDDIFERYYIIQFEGPVLEKWKDEVTGTGVLLFDYIPNNAFIVRMDPSQQEQVESLDYVKWTGEYKASYKHEIDFGSSSNLPLTSSAGTDTDLILVLFDENESEKIEEEIVSLGASVVESSGNILRVGVSRDMINDLAAIEGICWIEEYAVPVVFNDVAAEIINVNPVHNNYKLNGTGQIVAVCDTGLDTGVNDDTMHADIRGRILKIFDLVGDGAEDQTGHGTHATGSVLGNGTLLSGKYKGMAPEAKLVFQAAANDAGSLTGVPADLNELFQPAYNEGARIHTNSWGYTNNNGNYSAYSQQVDQFMWNHPDILILFSAGNLGVDVDKNGVVDLDSLTTPATAKNCLTVGASESNRPTFLTKWDSIIYGYPINEDIKANNIEGISANSSRGPTDDGRIKPDLVAPGTYITSTKSSLSIGTGDYTRMSGTSMATPLVAGAAVLTRQYYTDIEKLTSPSAALIKAALINGAHDMTPGQYGTGSYQEIQKRPDYSQGWGRVDVENSLFPEYPKVIAYYDNKTGLGTSGSWSAEYSYIEAGSPLRATLVWTDYPASLPSSKALVNNLDLTVKGGGNTYYGNGAPDSINNIEAVEIDSTTSGSYQFTVTGKNVPQGPQPFALVLSFTCDNNVFPAHNSNTSDSMTSIATDVVHPAGVNLSSISMKVNGSPVSYTNSAIDGGYRIQHATSTSFQNGEYNVSVTALTTKGQSFSYGWKFKVNASPVTVTGISVKTAPAKITYTEGEKLYLQGMVVTLLKSNSSTEDVAFANFGSKGITTSPANGTVLATSNTKVTITHAESGKNTTQTITVNTAPVKVTGITVTGTGNTNTVENGKTLQMIATIVPTNATNKNVTWSVTNVTGTASTTQTGLLTATGAGTVTVRAAATDGSGVTGNLNVTVTAVPVTLMSVTVSTPPAKITYTEGEKLDLQGMVVTLLKSNSSEEDVAFANFGSKGITVNPANGTVLATFNTKVTITHAESGKNTTQAITVNNAPIKVTGITVTGSGNSTMVEKDKTLQMSAEVSPENASNQKVAWSVVSINGTATITQAGLLTGTGVGIVTVKATAADGSGVTGSLNVTVTAAQSASTPTSSGGGGGGGGGGSSGEKAENIALKDVSSVFVGKDLTRFDFRNPGNDIQYIEYTSLKNSGTITATVEVLKDRSVFAGSSPEGAVYKHINIWLGKTGYATEANIAGPVVGFRVDNSWIADNSINPASVALSRYSDRVWSKLPTKQTGSDENYLYFEAKTPGFSPFAITGESLPEESTLRSTSDALLSTESTENGSDTAGDSAGLNGNETKAEKTLPALPVTITLLMVFFACFLIRKQ